MIVKVMPPDSLAQADADVGYVTSSEWLGPVVVRPYPYTTWVTLRAPPLTGSNYTFDHWVTQGSGGPRFWYAREIDVYASETITATAHYHWTGS